MHWLMTNTTYGTWLPGDPRGSVTAVRDRRVGEVPSSVRVRHNKVGQPYESELPGLRRAATQALKREPVWLTLDMAEAILPQFQETATYRRWELLAVSIMANHFHLVVQLADDQNQDRALESFKAYATRKLNRCYGRIESKRWTKRGSCRPLRRPEAVEAAVDYVLYRQPNPLVVWSANLGRLR